MNHGIVFYQTTDDVILTTGVDGFLTKDFFHKIIGFSESGIPLHQSVLWEDTDPDILSLHEERICIDDIPNRTFIVTILFVLFDAKICKTIPIYLDSYNKISYRWFMAFEVMIIHLLLLRIW